MNCPLFAALLLLAACAPVGQQLRAAEIKDNQGSGQDGLLYTFSAVNFPISSSFNVTPVGSTYTGHNTYALVQFDLSLLPSSLTAANVTSAMIGLHIGDTVATGFGKNPTSAKAVTIDAYPILGVWDRNTLTNVNAPSIGSLITSNVASDYSHLASDSGGVTDYWVTLDVTNTVKSWLANPSSNSGLMLMPDAVVADSPPTAGPYYFAAIDSGFGSFAAFAPTLTVVPEPSSVALVLAAMAIFAARPFGRGGAKRVVLSL